MSPYVRRGNRFSVNVAEGINQNEPAVHNTNTVNVTNIVTRDIKLEDLDEAPEEPELTPEPRQYPSSELWTVPVLRKIINAINNAYFNAKIIDNIINRDDLKSILEAVTNKQVEITLQEVEPKCAKCEKLIIMREVAKITVVDNGTQQNFKYVYNDVYEALLNDFHINMNRVFVTV